MRRNQRLHVLDRFAAVTFEGVGDVVITEAEENFDKPVREAVDQKFMFGIIDDAAAGNETGAKHTSICLAKFSIVSYKIVGAIRSIGHYNCNGIAGAMWQSCAHS